MLVCLIIVDDLVMTIIIFIHIVVVCTSDCVSMARRCRPLAHLVTIRIGIIIAMHRIAFCFSVVFCML